MVRRSGVRAAAADHEWPLQRRKHRIDARPDRKITIPARHEERLAPTDNSRFISQGHHNARGGFGQPPGEEGVQLIERVHGSRVEPFDARVGRSVFQRGDAPPRFSQGILTHGSVGLRGTGALRRWDRRHPHI